MVSKQGTLTEVIFKSSCSDSGARVSNGHEATPASTTRLTDVNNILAGSQQTCYCIARYEVDWYGSQTRGVEQCVDVSEDMIQSTFTAIVCHDTLHLPATSQFTLNVQATASNLCDRHGASCTTSVNGRWATVQNTVALFKSISPTCNKKSGLSIISLAADHVQKWFQLHRQCTLFFINKCRHYISDSVTLRSLNTHDDDDDDDDNLVALNNYFSNMQ